MKKSPSNALALLNESGQSPPNWHKPWPFFVLNDEYEPGRGEKRLSQLLESLRAAGFGGVYVHPRPGLITEYLSPRWFDLIRYILREAKRWGLHVGLYDENSYPSGFAGGHVSAQCPEARVRHVTPLFGSGRAALPAEYLALHHWNGSRPGALLKRIDVTEKTSWLAFVQENMQPSPWHGEFPYVSLLDPLVAPSFLNLTHERYRAELGGEWPQVESIFTDEPHLPAQGHGPWSPGLHCTPYVLAEFHKRTGYDLKPKLVDLYFDSTTSSSTRHDFYDVLHVLWMQNWALPLEAWCRKKRIPLTGHYLEHDWPLPYTTPGQMHCLAHMDWPGTDMLECFALAGHDDYDAQNLSPQPPGQEPHALYYLRQTHSVANQLEKKRVMNECWGAGGHDSTPADWLRIGRWLIVHGVNHLVPHCSFTTIRGSRKMDHPQFFSEQSPWFSCLSPLNDELARLCLITSAGKIHQRVLVLDALTTGYCLARKADCLSSDGKAMPSANPMRDSQKSVSDLRETSAAFAQMLSDHQIDFDIGDEYILEEFASVRAGKIAVGRQRYQLLVWPQKMTNLRRSTEVLIEKFLLSGGRLCGVKPKHVTINGRPSNLLNILRKRFSAQITWASDVTDLLAVIKRDCLPRVRGADRPGIAHQRRVMPGGEVFVFVNSAPQDFAAALSVETRFSHLTVFDPASGACRPFSNGDSLSIPANNSRVLFATASAPLHQGKRRTLRDDPEGEKVVFQPLKPVFLGARRREDNILVLDVCRGRIGSEEFPPALVYLQNERLWRAHGFGTRGWAGVIQYRDQVLARNSLVDHGLEAAFDYEFTASAAALRGGLRLAVECPEVWQVSVNGNKLSFSKGTPWLDHRILSTEISRYVRSGRNIVTLASSPFDVRQELDQIYILGDFSAVPSRPGFTLKAPKKIRLGSWKKQGLPFYDRAVEYCWKVPAAKGFLEIPEHAWRGSLLVIHDANGAHTEYGPSIKVPVQPGAGGLVRIVVIGLPKNLLGPFHSPAKIRKRAWPFEWYSQNTPTEPQAGADYDQLDVGLLTPPRWFEATGQIGTPMAGTDTSQSRSPLSVQGRT